MAAICSPEMPRRAFMGIIAGGLLAAPLAAEGQQSPRVYRIGVVSPISATPNPTVDALRQGLRELGYVEGQHFILEARFAEGRTERLPELVAETIRLKVDVLVVGSTLGAVAAKRTTTTVPVVFAGLYDPVGPGIVASLARPGANITGASMGIGGSGFAGKWVELLKESAPGVSYVAVLANLASPLGALLLPDIQEAARTMNVKLDVLGAENVADLDRALAAIGASGAQGIIVTIDPLFVANRTKLVQFAAGKRLPAVYFTKLFADAGGLMTYGGSLEDSWRRAATYVDKILKGTKPADLPIGQPTRFELVINLKTAKVLGLTIPPSLLQRADQVIE
ncbi:MAG: ABC transporter substrate-binding protein [Candidatus Rokuibacteriota bacterium]